MVYVRAQATNKEKDKTMTRKHYRELAEDFAQLLNVCNEDERRGAIDAIKILMNSLKAENPAFSKDKFQEACGL